MFQILLGLLAIYFFHRRRPGQLQRIASLRSKMYLSVYPKEKFERPILKAEFVVKTDQLLAEDESNLRKKLEEEFAELEQVSFIMF